MEIYLGWNSFLTFVEPRLCSGSEGTDRAQGAESGRVLVLRGTGREGIEDDIDKHVGVRAELAGKVNSFKIMRFFKETNKPIFFYFEP